MRKRNTFEASTRQRQENVLPPALIRNVARFDAALWTGKGITSKLQKAGVIVLGLFFFLSGCFYLAVTLGIYDEGVWRGWDFTDIFIIVFALSLAGFGLVIGYRFFFNLLGTSKNGAKHRSKGGPP